MSESRGSQNRLPATSPNITVVGVDEGNRDAVDVDALRRKRILLVQGDGEALGSITRVLRLAGFRETVTASSAPQALRCLHESTADGICGIDLILVRSGAAVSGDINLGDIVLGRAEWCAIPIVMITTLGGWQEVMENTANYPCITDVLIEPATEADIVSRVTTALKLKLERDRKRFRDERIYAELSELRVAETRLHYLIDHDNLTGLYNRLRLERELTAAVEEAAAHAKPAALLYLDLDQFKIVNETTGHSVGDIYLHEVANVLRRNVPADHLLFRIGSDEFAVLLRRADRPEVLKLAETVRRSLDAFQFEAGGLIYSNTASIGVALIRGEKTETASDVLARADKACFIAKAQGRNRIHEFSHGDVEVLNMHDDVRWVPTIREALAKGRFFLVYQPVRHISTGTVRRYETLLRLRDQKGNVHAPGLFIPVAERTGLIHEIDRWVVVAAIDSLKTIPDDISLNINLSGHSFADPKLLDLVSSHCRGAQIRPERLTFEITETAAIASPVQTRRLMENLRALGCRFALDDFGTGFNSFSTLKRFPVDMVKIDGSFVVNLLNDSVDQALVKSIVEVAHTLGKKIVAEFVEQKPILELLSRYGVDFAQGSHIGMPREWNDA